MLTEEQIAESRIERARLQAIADRLGLKCDVAELRNPLRAIADALDAQGGVSSTRAAASAMPMPRVPLPAQVSHDVGDAAAAIMAERRGKRLDAARAPKVSQ